MILFCFFCRVAPQMSEMTTCLLGVSQTTSKFQSPKHTEMQPIYTPIKSMKTAAETAENSFFNGFLDPTRAQ